MSGDNYIKACSEPNSADSTAASVRVFSRAI
jgi:hypothetical protein